MAEKSKQLRCSVCSAGGLNSQNLHESGKCEVGWSGTYFKNDHIRHAAKSQVQNMWIHIFQFLLQT
jgi:hypothetical protein